MKRDWDLVRSILGRLEELPPQDDLNESGIDGYDPAIVADHMLMMAEQNLIGGIPTTTLGGRGFIAQRLTWEGHDLLGKIRNDTAWNSVKASAKSKGLDLSVDLVKAFAKAYIKSLGVDI